MSLSRKGVIIGGEYAGWGICVEDDRDSDTGGCYLYLQKNDKEGFDCWFEDELGLNAQLTDYEVDWLTR
jgi:hypothetical protein